MITRYGWKKDKLDPRDHRMLMAPRLMESLPSSVDLGGNCGPVFDQGQLGSCTGNAIAAAFQYDLKVQGCSIIFTPSRLFVYYNEREMEGTVYEDSGAEIRDGMKAVATFGVCDEALWPYNVDIFTTKPPPAAYSSASEHKAILYQKVDQTEDGIRAALASGFPIVFGFNVFEAFESEEVAQSGVLMPPFVGERPVGGHAVLAVGYQDDVRRIKVRNSWGPDWGMGGYFTMPYDYITNPDLASDLWVMQRVQS